MGISPSVLPPSILRTLGSKSRWPPSLQNVCLTQLVQWYSIFRELGSVRARPRHLALVMEVTEADMMVAAEIWQVGRDEYMNIWELLALLAATSASLSINTKLAFFFRMWDVDHDRKLHLAEMVFLLRALLNGLARFSGCDRSQLPTSSATMRKYVERTFKATTYEETFVAWAKRYRLLKSVLQAFTPSTKLVDFLDFVLSGPKELGRTHSWTMKAQSRLAGRASLIRRGSSSLLDEKVRPTEGDSSDDPDSEKAKKEPASASPPSQPKKRASQVSNFALPTVGEDVDEEEEADKEEQGELRTGSRSSILQVLPEIRNALCFSYNEPVNLPSQGALLGHLRLLEAEASWGDAQHRCKLHPEDEVLLEQARSGVNSPASVHKFCTLFTKHEVLLCNRIWHFVKENRDMEMQAVRDLLDMIQTEVNEQESVLVMSEHRNIFELMDTRSNRLFKNVVRKLLKGGRVSFLDFLRASCPCASEARIRLYEYWQVQLHWSAENGTMTMIKTWRKEFEAERADSELNFDDRSTFTRQQSPSDFDPNERILTMEDLVSGNVIPQDVAIDVMQKHPELGAKSEINESEFIKYFVHEGMRDCSIMLEDMMRRKFERLAESQKRFRRYSVTSLVPPQSGGERKPSKDNSLAPLQRKGSRKSSRKLTQDSSKTDSDQEADKESRFRLAELLGTADVMAAFDLMDAFEEIE